MGHPWKLRLVSDNLWCAKICSNQHLETYLDVSEMKSSFIHCWLLLGPVDAQGSSEARLVPAVVWWL